MTMGCDEVVPDDVPRGVNVLPNRASEPPGLGSSPRMGGGPIASSASGRRTVGSVEDVNTHESLGHSRC